MRPGRSDQQGSSHLLLGGFAAAACLRGQGGAGDSRMLSMALSTLPNASRVLSPRPPPAPQSWRGGQSQSLPPARRRHHAAELEEVEGARSMLLHGARSGHVDWLSLAALPGAQPCVAPFSAHTHRTTDPLKPAYELPQVPHAPLPELPFKRDLHTVTDIEGAQPRPRRVLQPRADAPRLESAKHRTIAPRGVQHATSKEDVSDIVAGRHFACRTQRSVDVQAPVYAIHGRVVADDPAGVHPRPARQGRRGSLSLDGAAG